VARSHHRSVNVCLMSPEIEKSKVFQDYRVWKKHLKRELSQCLFRTIVQRDRKRVKLSLGGRVSSNTLTSVKIARSLDNLFMFRES
jgi:hypothetical protein